MMNNSHFISFRIDSKSYFIAVLLLSFSYFYLHTQLSGCCIFGMDGERMNVRKQRKGRTEFREFHGIKSALPVGG